MNLKIQSALISVFNKEGLESIVRRLHALNIKIYSTGGTQSFIEQLGIPCVPVEGITRYPSILGGRVKTLHPKIFGGILARRNFPEDRQHVKDYSLPLFDLVIVDLYPFEETVKHSNDEAEIIEKIDIGGVSLIRAAAKNYADVTIISHVGQYQGLLDLLESGGGNTSLDIRRTYAAEAFGLCAHYDVAISDYFNRNNNTAQFQLSVGEKLPLRYGENPHQSGTFYGELDALFEKLSGKELSYNNLADTDSALQLIAEFSPEDKVFAVIKHTNVCGAAIRDTLSDAWDAALAGDPESAFGGVLVTNQKMDLATAEKINELFFEILIAPGFDPDALNLLMTKKNRILLLQKQPLAFNREYRRMLNGVLVQESDRQNFQTWTDAGGRPCSDDEKAELTFANILCKHLKSNAIAIVKDLQLIGKGCGQTSRIDSLRHAIDKAGNSGFSTEGAVMASDAFFPFDDCVRMANEAGIQAVIQPGGSIRDKDSVEYARQHDMAMVMTQTRHFRH